MRILNINSKNQQTYTKKDNKNNCIMWKKLAEMNTSIILLPNVLSLQPHKNYLFYFFKCRAIKELPPPPLRTLWPSENKF